MTRAIRELGVIIAGAFIISFILRTAAFATYYIPSESMVPTLEVGDRLAVSKFSYGWSRYSVPGVGFQRGEPRRLFGQVPKRGDVAVFQHPHAEMTMIKRVIGLPGDRISVRRGRLIINGKLVPRTFIRDYAYREHNGGVVKVRQYSEQLPGAGVEPHPIIERTDYGYADQDRDFQVPQGHLFMMGDNRDNSADSRFRSMGFVPIGNLVGRADAILFSFKSCTSEPGLSCPGSRYLSLIR